MSVEPWLRGPVEDVPATLQPAAHALLNALADVEGIIRAELSDEELRARPGGAASIAWHLTHLTGALDRLLTYAADRALSDAQMAALAREADHAAAGVVGVEAALVMVRTAIERAMAVLRTTDPGILTHARAVGRARLPSTVGGLLFHAAEHTARHAGQAVTTFRVVRGLDAR